MPSYSKDPSTINVPEGAQARLEFRTPLDSSLEFPTTASVVQVRLRLHVSGERPEDSQHVALDQLGLTGSQLTALRDALNPVKDALMQLQAPNGDFGYTAS